MGHEHDEQADKSLVWSEGLTSEFASHGGSLSDSLLHLPCWKKKQGGNGPPLGRCCCPCAWDRLTGGPGTMALLPLPPPPPPPPPW